MNDIYMKPEFAVFAVVLILESVKVLLLGSLTAYHRGKSGKFINSEDVEWLGGELVINDDPRSGRLQRAHRNSIENLVPFSLLGLIYLAVGANGAIGMVYFTCFLISRMLHTYAYLKRKPSLRRNAYSGAWVIQLAMAMHVSILIATVELIGR